MSTWDILLNIEKVYDDLDVVGMKDELKGRFSKGDLKISVC